MRQILTAALLLTGSFGLNVPNDPKTLKQDAAAQKAEALKYFENNLMKNLQDAKTPFLCPMLKVQKDFDLDTYISLPWYSQRQQPLLYNNVDTLRCVRADYRKKEGLPNNYDIQVYNQAVNIDTGERRGAGGDSGGMALCSQQVDGAKLRVAPCDLDPEYAAGPYWVIHYEEGDDGFVIVAGGDPYLPTPDTGRKGGGWSCGYLGLLTNNSGLWFLSRKPKATEATFAKAKDIILKAGLAWSQMMPVDQEKCDYLDPDATA